MSGSSSARRRRRLWRFAGAEFDEAGWALRVRGRIAPLEGKPLEVLHELLLRAGEVVTKEELLDAVWPGVAVVEGSLPTAISKLRKALGSQEDTVIETVPRVGYRLVAPVRIDSIESPLAPRFTFAAGDSVPGRPQWALREPLGDTGAGDVWLAQHSKTGERRVFKFADAPDRLRALKREAALTRVLFAGLGVPAPLPALLEWNFETSPYWLEYAYGGRDLLRWAEDAGGLARIPMAVRLDVAHRICAAVAAIHSLGVLHKDLKPANILIDAEGAIRLADFGSGRLIDEVLLHSFRITDPGALEPGLDPGEARSGTLAYRAPELAGEALPTIRSDIYALGLILHQLVAGDFAAALAPGWESRIADPLLRDDIRAAAEVEPDRRLDSAATLAHRLRHLEDRRAAAAQDAERAAFLDAQRRLEERRRQRRPWVRAAAASLAIGLIVSTTVAVYAWTQRNHALAARQLADAGYGFIAEDVLASPDPARSGSADESVVEAISRASRSIDARFAASPQTAARLHLAIARAFHGRGEFDLARAEYARADQLFGRAGESDDAPAVLGRLARIQMEATSGQPDRLQEAGRLLGVERAALGARGERGPIGFALAQAEGAYGYMADLPRAEHAFRRAAAIGDAEPSVASATQRLKVKSSLALTLMRLGRPGDAEPVARAIVAESERTRGVDHPDTLVTRQHWLNALSMLGRHDDTLQASAPLLAAMQARFGPDHRFTLALHSTRFESLAATGRYDEAAEEAERVWRGAARQTGPRSHQALVGQIDHASALCRTSRRALGLDIARDARSAVESAFGTAYPLTHAIRYALAECLIADRRFVEAGPLLERLDRQKIAELTGQTQIGGRVDLGLAEVALARGDRAAARALLASVSADLGAADVETRGRVSALVRALGRTG